MPEWGVALICFAVVVVAILCTSAVKMIMKYVAKKNGTELDCKKWEYLFAAISLLLSGLGVFLFLRFGVKVTDVNVLVKTTATYAGSVQTIYLFIVQLSRKGIKEIIEVVKKIVTALKQSDNPVEELPEKIKEETNPDVEKLEKDLDKIIKK